MGISLTRLVGKLLGSSIAFYLMRSVGLALLCKPVSLFAASSTSSLANYYPVDSETGVLPQQTIRMRLIHKTLFSDFGFTSQSERENPGVDVVVQALGFSTEVAVTDSLSIGFGLPFVYSNRAGFNDEKFKSSDIFATNYATYRQLFIDKLIKQGECKESESCRARFDAGMTLPVNVDFRVPSTNEGIVIPKDVPLRTTLEGLIVNAARQENGSTGLGDLQLGARLRVLKNTSAQPFALAVNSNLYFPTGTFANVPRAQRAVGRGVPELGIGVGADYYLTPEMVFSASYLGTGALASSLRKVTGVVNNNTLASGACDASGTGNNSDGECIPVASEQSYGRDGLRHTLHTDVSIVPFGLKMIALSASYNLDIDSVAVNAGVADPREMQMSAIFGLTWTGLNNSTLIPLEVKLEYEEPFRGTNKLIATRVLSLTAAGFLAW